MSDPSAAKLSHSLDSVPLTSPPASSPALRPGPASNPEVLPNRPHQLEEQRLPAVTKAKLTPESQLPTWSKVTSTTRNPGHKDQRGSRNQGTIQYQQRKTQKAGPRPITPKPRCLNASVRMQSTAARRNGTSRLQLSYYSKAWILQCSWNTRKKTLKTTSW